MLRVRLRDADGTNGEGYFESFRLNKTVKMRTYRLFSILGHIEQRGYLLHFERFLGKANQSGYKKYLKFAYIGKLGNSYDIYSIGDSLSYHNGMPFATKDLQATGECAKASRGAWW